MPNPPLPTGKTGAAAKPAVTPLKITSPAPNIKVVIPADAIWPSIPIQTNATLTTGQKLTWDWKIQWKTYVKSGKVQTDTAAWDAKDAIENMGGTLTVKVTGPSGVATATLIICGTQPAETDVTTFLATKADSAGFEKILKHETKMKHFDAKGEPVKSFDNGFGMCQLTTPAPTYQQVWNWKLNIEGGLALFAQKRTAAINYLSQSGRSYTDDQLVRETVCRWNGGSYHVWNADDGWVRNADILCDTNTGNIGWKMSDPENKGKTEAQLRTRDKDKYSKPPAAGARWGYFGVCYADRILES